MDSLQQHVPNRALVGEHFPLSARARLGFSRLLFTSPVRYLPSQLPETHELIWDDGTKHPEPCMDDPLPNYTRVRAALRCPIIADLCGGRGCLPRHSPPVVLPLALAQGDAAKMLAAGFGVYAFFWQMCIWNDKASKQPFVVRECQPLPSRA